MKIFGIYAKVVLTQKPDWLDEFRKKFDEPSEFHVTLKSPCFIDEGDIDILRQLVAQFVGDLKIENHIIPITFDEVVIFPNVIMINAHEAKLLVNLQKNLCDILSRFNDYVKPEYERHDRDFMPHITIAQNIHGDQQEEIDKYLGRGYVSSGVVSSITLAVIKDQSIEERTNPHNQTVLTF